jgi:5'-deoxynucleotidase YfbR-like HD superfamily hydrolase
MVPPAIGRDWRQLWDEYEAAESADAKLVKQLDKVSICFLL